ncbi:hypothetical protein BDV06DRAFT_195179 [Aspergillus oleicola]
MTLSRKIAMMAKSRNMDRNDVLLSGTAIVEFLAFWAVLPKRSCILSRRRQAQEELQVAPSSCATARTTGL